MIKCVTYLLISVLTGPAPAITAVWAASPVPCGDDNRDRREDRGGDRREDRGGDRRETGEMKGGKTGGETEGRQE